MHEELKYADGPYTSNYKAQLRACNLNVLSTVGLISLINLSSLSSVSSLSSIHLAKGGDKAGRYTVSPPPQKKCNFKLKSVKKKTIQHKKNEGFFCLLALKAIYGRFLRKNQNNLEINGNTIKSVKNGLL